jgi:RNA polymerase sigma factor (sigma-70 family)
MHDGELLESFAATASEAAFAELVRRHVDAVYSAARRQLRDAQSAEDVTQAVFCILAQKAAKLDRQAPLAGWLLKTTYFACQDARRRQARRQRHEQAAALLAGRGELDMREPSQGVELEEIGAELDAVLAGLGRRDRDAVTLRYLQGKSVDETADAMGVSPGAAGKRIARALNRLRKGLLRRGVIAPGVGLAVALDQLPRWSAPPALAQSLISAAVTHTSASAAGTLIAKGTLHMMNWIKIKLAALLIACTAAAATAGVGAVALLQAQNDAPPAPPPNVNAADLQPQPVSFAGSLDNGVSIEVIGVSENPSRGKSWWKADGSPLAQRPYDRMFGSAGGDGLVARELAVVINRGIANKSEPADVRWGVVNAHGSSSGSVSGAAVPGTEAEAVSVDDNPDGMTIRADIAAGGWTTQFTASGYGGSSESSSGPLGKRSVLFGSPVDNHGKTQIPVTCTGIPSNTSVRLVAVDSANREIPATTMSLMSDGNAVMGEFRSDLPLAVIKQWKLQTRPFDQWIEIRHISLHPGRQTNVQIVTSDDPAKN